jgi:hypothetical protein
MRHLLTLLLATLCAASACGQTIKTLGYNSTNFQVIANTGTNFLTFTNTIQVGSISSKTESGFSIAFENGQLYGEWETVGTWIFLDGFNFGSDAVAAQSRTNLGLPLPALTQTSNVTMMRALSGSTNTNHPFSGSVALTNTNVLVFSNGILQSVQ